MLFMPAAQAQEDGALDGLYEFAGEHGIDLPVDAISGFVRDPGSFSPEALLSQLRTWAGKPVRELFTLAAGVFPAMLFLILLRAMLPDANGGAGAAVFLIRLHIALGFTDAIMSVIEDTVRCLNAALELSDVLSPILTALLAGSGLAGASSLISPAAALTANLIEALFLRWGIPLCRIALCCAIAGNLSKSVSLKPVYRFVKKGVNWGAGMAVTIFTAILSLQGGMAVSMDGVGLRTAKYAVDSAGPIIGSGISDAWETYVSGMAVARNTAGISGIAVILALNALPLVRGLGCMLLLRLFSAAAEIMGEDGTAALTEQFSGVCQMSVSLLAGGMAAVTILLTATLAAGRGLFG